MSVSQFYKNLLDVDAPGGGYSLAQDGWIPSFIGSTQHFHLIDPSVLVAISLGEVTNVATAVDTAANNDFLVYSTGTSKWRNLSLAAVTALVSPTFDALTNVDFSGKASGSVPYWDTSGTPTWKQKQLASLVAGTATAGYVVTAVAGVATWAAPSAAGTFQGASQGYVTYNNTGGNITSGSWSYTAANSTPQFVQLTGEVSINSATDATIQIKKNGTNIADQSCAALAGNGWVNVTSPFVPCTSGDVFTFVTTAGTREQFAIQAW